MAQPVKNLPAMQETWVRSLGWEDSPGEGKGSSLQHSCLKSSMDRRVWRARAHGVAESAMTEQLKYSLCICKDKGNMRGGLNFQVLYGLRPLSLYDI